MSEPKLSKIIIHKFGEYHGEIKVKNCTIINCVYITSKQINEISNIFKFMFSKEDDIASIQDFPGICLEAEHDWPFVEAHIQTSNENVCIMRKSCKQRSIIYEINEIKTTADNFKNKMHDFGCLFSFTSQIAQKTIQAIMNLDDNTRSILIEGLCDNLELKARYNQNKTKMEELEIEMKFLNDHKREFTKEKNLEMVKVQNSKKVRKAFVEYEKKFEELTLLKLFYNEKLISYEIPQKQKKSIEEINFLKVEHQNLHEQNRDSFNKIIQVEKDFHNSEFSFATIDHDLSECLKTVLIYQKYFESLSQHQVFSEKLQFEHTKIESKLNNETIKFTNVKKICDQFENYILKHKDIEIQFSEKHYNNILLNIIIKRIAQTETIKDCVEMYENHLKIITEQRIYLEEQIQTSNEIEKSLDRKLSLYELNLEKFKEDLNQTEKDLNSTHQMIIEKLHNENSSMRNIKILEQKLREKYHGKVIGMLSDLFDVNNSNGIAVNKSQIIELLGKYSHAIVVENFDTFNEIKDNVKMLQYDTVDVILLPQNYFPKFISKSNVTNRSIQNVKFAPVENFIKPISDEIKTILMYILKPRIICDCESINDMANVFKTLGQKTIVTSFNARKTYYSRNNIKEHPTTDGNENVLELTKRFIEYKTKLTTLKSTFDMEKTRHSLCFNRFKLHKIVSTCISDVLKQNSTKINIIKSKILKLNEIVTNEKGEFLLKLKRFAEDLYKEIQPLIDEHFQELYSETGIQSIQMYQNFLDKINSFDIIQKFHADLTKAQNDVKTYLESLSTLRNWNSLKEEEESKVLEMLNLQQNIQLKNQEQHNMRVNSQMRWSNEMIQFLETNKNYLHSKDKLKIQVLNHYIQINEPKMLTNQNYKLLSNAFKDFFNIRLRKGSLMSLYEVPILTSIDEEFDLIESQLSQIQPNFDVLSKKLKEKDDLQSEINTLSFVLKSLEKNLISHPFDFASENNELAEINEKIKSLSMEIKASNNECQKVLSALKTVTESRKNRFNECLNIINKEIQKYCQIISNGQINSELISPNEQEPFSNGLQYYWQTGNRAEMNVDPKLRNWEAALAFLIGILTYKRQFLIPYFEVCSELPILNNLIKYSTNNRAKMQAIIFWKTGIQEERCHYTIIKLNNKICIQDNEEIQKMSENF